MMFPLAPDKKIVIISLKKIVLLPSNNLTILPFYLTQLPLPFQLNLRPLRP